MEEKSFSIEDLERIMGKDTAVSRIDFRKLYAVLVLNWHWFLLSLLLCIGGAGVVGGLWRKFSK